MAMGGWNYSTRRERAVRMVAVAIEAVAEKLVGMGTRCAVGVGPKSTLVRGAR